MPFQDNEVSVAYAMMNVLGRHAPRIDPRLISFCCCWMAFNNIYVRISERNNNRPDLRRDGLGVPQFEQVGQFMVPLVQPVSEKGMIEDAILSVDEQVRHDLLRDSAFTFFIGRTPHLDGQHVRVGVFNQQINGVLNVGYTRAVAMAVWAPIDPDQHRQYVAAPSRELRDELSRQLARLLYTVRNNTFHGGKEPEDENAMQVIGNAYVLLDRIVTELLTA